MTGRPCSRSRLGCRTPSRPTMTRCRRSASASDRSATPPRRTSTRSRRPRRGRRALPGARTAIGGDEQNVRVAERHVPWSDGVRAIGTTVLLGGHCRGAGGWVSRLWRAGRMSGCVRLVVGPGARGVVGLAGAVLGALFGSAGRCSRAAARSCSALSGSCQATSALWARHCWGGGSGRSPRGRYGTSRGSRLRSRAGQRARHRMTWRCGGGSRGRSHVARGALARDADRWRCARAPAQTLRRAHARSAGLADALAREPKANAVCSRWSWRMSPRVALARRWSRCC